MRVTRSSLRPGPAAKSVQAVVDDPEQILRKPRNSKKPRDTTRRPDPLIASNLIKLAESIEPIVAEARRGIDGPLGQLSSEGTPSSQEIDSEQRFYRTCGYLPPLDEEAAAIIDAIIADPDMAKDQKRINPENPLFSLGLRSRNVFLHETASPDPYAEHIAHLVVGNPIQESEEEMELHGRLWDFDQAKCNNGSNEALFQRTLMMSLIARHSIIYEVSTMIQPCLDFSVEEPWSCPPMPTKAYESNERYLTQPKPDLALCFRREAVMSDAVWNSMPTSTKRLACFENVDETRGSRVFHFFTIEAKKALVATDDIVAKRQSLNNASQALHNMYEFFHDAGPQHEDGFFDKVRFFSVVASTEGLTIRIHRATKEPADHPDQGSIISDYPLRFEYREYCKILKDSNFDRSTVLKTFERILIAYGADELRFQLKDAAESIIKKLKNDPEGRIKRANADFYRHGQTKITPDSRNPTPSGTRRPSKTSASSAMVMSGTVTPTQARPTQVLNAYGKRPRVDSDNILVGSDSR